MYVKTENAKTEVLEKLLNDARAEADELRARIARYENIIVSTRIIMGHELKKPATAINGYLELVAEELERKQERDTLAFVEKAVDECDLLNDLNDYFIELLKVGPGSAMVGQGPVDLKALLDEVVSNVREEMRTDRGINVSIDMPDSRVRVDGNALKLVVMNLLENALKYSQVDTPVKLEAEKGIDRRGRSDKPLLTIRVIDDGVGIPDRFVQRVFEPFVRLRNDVCAGSGLGLTLVRSLVELNGGEVSIKSGTGRGTTVFVTLPIDARDGGRPAVKL